MIANINNPILKLNRHNIPAAGEDCTVEYWYDPEVWKQAFGGGPNIPFITDIPDHNSIMWRLGDIPVPPPNGHIRFKFNVAPNIELTQINVTTALRILPNVRYTNTAREDIARANR